MSLEINRVFVYGTLMTHMQLYHLIEGKPGYIDPTCLINIEMSELSAMIYAEYLEIKEGRRELSFKALAYYIQIELLDLTLKLALAFFHRRKHFFEKIH